jgi:DNA-binding HxlR family transcriptional regulator
MAYREAPPSAAPRGQAHRRTRHDLPPTRPRAADLLADRWCALILAAAFFGLHRFADLEAALDIAPNILTTRLRRLAHWGLLDRHAYQQRPVRHAYHLTARGQALYPLVIALLTWGDRWLRPAGRSLILLHRPCGKELQPRLGCGRCGRLLDPGDNRPRPV